jgi:arginyl-tRNA synthetase
MEYTLDRFASEIRGVIVATGLVPPEAIVLEAPKISKTNVVADLAFPCFRVGKQLRIAPPDLARRIAEAIVLPSQSLIGAVEAVGPFLNFVLDKASVARGVLQEVDALADRYGSNDVGAGQTIVLDYSAPNVAKRMHVGHIRSTIIGQALNNIFMFNGYRTIADNHLGDYGKQFGVLIAAVKHFGRPSGEGEEALADIEAIYSRYNTLMGSAAADDDEPDVLDDAARAWSLKLEQGDPEAQELWQWMVDMTLRSNQVNYDRLGVRFDRQHGESFYAPMCAAILDDVQQQVFAEREAGGALVVRGLLDASGKELSTFLLQRSDGATLYSTRDVATVLYREEQWDPQRMVYVVEQKQELHFRQVFALARALGYAGDAALVHITFGTVFGPNGEALSTRAGNMIHLETLLDEAHARAARVIEQKIREGKTTFTPDQTDELAETVGVGAVIYNDLYQDPKRSITLDWDRMLAFEGNSAPYIQYTHARCCSILRDGADVLEGADPSLLDSDEEQAVLKQLGMLPAVVREAAEQYAPYQIAEWLYQTSREFARFYRERSVLHASSPELRAARLRLVRATAQGLKNGLALLSIRAPERM